MCFGTIGAMLKKMFHALAQFVRFLLLFTLSFALLARLLTGLAGWMKIYDETAVPARRVAIVFGAGLTRSGEATAVLRDRIQTAARLYFSGKAQKLLMTGDNSTVYYNEPAAMREYALSLGVPPEAIVLDFAGRRTYDSCYRAKAIFGVQQAILVTQAFHLPRALYLCNALGVDAVGVAAENIPYRRASLIYWNLREWAASMAALVDVHITRPLPILGDPEPSL